MLGRLTCFCNPALTDLKSNQRKLNGHVSMLIKIICLGKDWNHDSRMRESMLSNALAVCPLWLLFKFHKGWEQKSGKVAPTRPVAGGNDGMNFPLSEISSWILEPLASTIKDSSEVISGEDLWSRVNGVNNTTRDWSPEPELK